MTETSCHRLLQVKSALYVIGSPHIEHAGTVKISNLQSSLVANIKFEAGSMFSWSDTHQVMLRVVLQSYRASHKTAVFS